MGVGLFKTLLVPFGKREFVRSVIPPWSRVAQLLVTWRSQKGQLSSHLNSGVRRRTEVYSSPRAGVGLGGKEDLDSASHFIECEKLVSDPGTDGLITPMNGGCIFLSLDIIPF